MVKNDKMVHPSGKNDDIKKRVRVSPDGRVMIRKSDIKALKESLPKKAEISSSGIKTYDSSDISSDVSSEESTEKIGDLLNEKAPLIEVPLSGEDITALKTYAAMLREKNKVMNLTNITDDEGIAVRHFVDSLTIIPFIRDEQKKQNRDNLSIIDVGTGAGFPGIPVKIAVKELELTLLDSLQKRIGFLDDVVKAVDLDKTKTVHSRAEDAGHDSKYRGKYDISVARAVAALPILCEYCLPFVKKGGIFLAMKAKSDEEVESSANAVYKLGGKIEKVEKFVLPGTDMERSVIVIRKISDTPSQYPRKAGTPSKNPL